MTERERWLKARKNGIGASEAAIIIGASPYKTNVALWEEKTGRRAAEDISNKPYVKYGTEAEKHLRVLFALDHPRYRVDYDEFGMIANCEAAPFAFATLDGCLTDSETGQRGVLEIKTTQIMQAGQYRQWKSGVPQHYYIQIVHQLMATGFAFSCLKAQIKFDIDGDIWCRTNHYWFDRADLLDDITFLQQKEREFWDCVQSDRRPNLVLPDI